MSKYSVGDVVKDGVIVEVIDFMYYVEMTSKQQNSSKETVYSSLVTGWGDEGLNNPVYNIKLNTPTRKFSLEEFKKYYKEELEFIKEDYLQQYYERAIPESKYLILPESKV